MIHNYPEVNLPNVNMRERFNEWVERIRGKKSTASETGQHGYERLHAFMAQTTRGCDVYIILRELH